MTDLIHNMWVAATHLAASPLAWVPALTLVLIAISIAIGPRGPR